MNEIATRPLPHAPTPPAPSARTIFAPASGPGRSALTVLRLSGAHSGRLLQALAGGLPPPRRASLCALRAPETGEVLDRALVLWFPAPESYTGEDCAELHLHGGRAVLEGVASALVALGASHPRQSPGQR